MKRGDFDSAAMERMDQFKKRAKRVWSLLQRMTAVHYPIGVMVNTKNIFCFFLPFFLLYYHSA